MNFQDFLKNVLPFVCIASGQKVLADSPFVIFAHPCVLAHVLVETDGTNDAVLTVYDNASAATGKIIAKITVNGTDHTSGIISLYVIADNGITCSLTGTASKAYVFHVDTSRKTVDGQTIYN